MSGLHFHQKKKYWSLNIKMTVDPLVCTQKGHTAAETEEVCLHFSICLDRKTFSGLFYFPLHFFLAGFVLWSHSLLPESREVFLQIPLFSLASLRTQHHPRQGSPPPPPGIPHTSDPCADPDCPATGSEGKSCMMGTTGIYRHLF